MIFVAPYPGKASVLGSIAMLFRCAFAVFCNGKIPNLKLVSALMNVHNKKEIYHHKEECALWAPNAGGKLRMAAKHFRDLAADEDKLETCMRKAHGACKTKN